MASPELVTPPASEVGTAEDDAVQPPTPPTGPPVGARASPQANFPKPGQPPTPSRSRARVVCSGCAMASSVDVGQDMLERPFDTAAKFSSDVRGRVTPAEAVRQIAKRYTLLSQGVVVAWWRGWCWCWR